MFSFPLESIKYQMSVHISNKTIETIKPVEEKNYKLKFKKEYYVWIKKCNGNRKRNLLI